MTEPENTTQGRGGSREAPPAILPQIGTRFPELLRHDRNSRRLEATARTLLGCCKNLIGADSGYVALSGREGKAVEPLFVDPGEWFCLLDSSLPMLLRSMAEVACRSGKPVYTNDFLHSEFASLIPRDGIPLGNVLFAPFAVSEETGGLLALANKAGGFTGKDTATASMLCDLASIALMNCLDGEHAEGVGGGAAYPLEVNTDGLPGSGRCPALEPARRKHGQTDMPESADNLRLLVVQLQEAQERERRRISFELHEGVAQAIVVLKMELNSLKSRLRSGRCASVDAGCDRMIEHLDGVIRNVRRLYSRLSPAAVEDLGFPGALQSMMREFGESTGIRCMSAVPDSLQGVWPIPVQISLYRILQDALENVARTEDLVSITLDAERSGSFIIFSLEARGGLPSARPAGRTLLPEREVWLSAMAERMKLMGGTLVTEGQKAAETRLGFVVPLNLSMNFVRG